MAAQVQPHGRTRVMTAQNASKMVILIPALFTIAKTWEPPKCPKTEEWIKKMWYVYTMEYDSAIKKTMK